MRGSARGQVGATNVAAAGVSAGRAGHCRFCGTLLQHSVVDLGPSPLCQRHVHEEEVHRPEIFYPLHAFVCERCFLVQLGLDVDPAEIFGFYHYFSSYSDSWLEHCRRYVETMVARFSLDAGSRVAEVGSNDGYLLQYFVERRIPAFGIEPAENVARGAAQRGVDTEVCFFGEAVARQLAARRGRVDLLIGNNVLAHVPDLNDFVAGLCALLAPAGVLTMEFPHLLRLVEGNQFDTIYHEHFSYFSLATAEEVFAHHGLRIFDVEELPTHGGSLRIFACHASGAERPAQARLLALREQERAAGMRSLAFYASFADRVRETKRRLLGFLIDAADTGKQVAGYGAPGKGNTLLNYCGVRTDLLAYTVDRNPLKQGTYLPGTRIPVHAPERIAETRPDYVLILPWNLKEEVMQQMAHVRDWGGRFVVPIPEVQVL